MTSSEKEYFFENIPCSIDFESTEPAPGTISLYTLNQAIVCEWISNDKQSFDLIACNLEQSWIFFYLHDVQSLQLTYDDSLGCVLRFSIPQMQTFSRFLLKDTNATLAIKNTIDQLLSQGYIIPHPQYNTVYKVQTKPQHKYIIPHDSLNLVQVQCLHAQRVAVKKLPVVVDSHYSSLSKAEFQSHFDSDGRIANFEQIKEQIFAAGLDTDVRPFAWPYLFGMYQPTMTKTEIEQANSHRQLIYENLRAQCDLVNERQFTYNPYRRVILQDVIRTDRTDPLFSIADSPAAAALTNILNCYAINDPDTGYAQGMGDFVVPLFKVFIAEFFADHMILFDGRSVPTVEAESFIFWLLVNMLKISQQDRLFAHLSNGNQFISDRVFAIIKSAHPLMATWLSNNQLTNLLFLHNSVLLQFRREFPYETIVRVWDCFYSAEDANVFIRFYSAAILFFIFPEAMSTNTSQLGDIQALVVASIKKIDGLAITRIAKQLVAMTKQDSSQSEWLRMKLPDQHSAATYKPRYMKFNSL